MTLSQLARDCRAYLERPAVGYSKETTATYDKVWRDFLAFLKAHEHQDDVRAFTAESVDAFKDALIEHGGDRGTGAKGSTVVKMLSALSTLADYGVKTARAMKVNPCGQIRWPRSERTTRDYLLPEPLKAILLAPAPAHEAIVRDFIVDTWLRVGQVIRLNVGSVRTIGAETYVRVPCKGAGGMKRMTELPVSPAIAATLGPLVDRDPDEPLFRNAAGQRWPRERLCSAVARLGRRVGVVVSIHLLRHTANSIARSLAGLDEHTRSLLLTHLPSGPAVRTYDHAMPRELVRARARYRAALCEYIGVALDGPSACRHEHLTASGGSHVCLACGASFTLSHLIPSRAGNPASAGEVGSEDRRS